MKFNKRIIVILAVLLALSVFAVFFLYSYNIIPHKKFDSESFAIDQYKSEIDMDNDGVDDQTDILNEARAYLATNPKYKSVYYPETGYPNDGYGVCTDVVAFALKNSGYDLMSLVNQDVIANPDDYDIETPDIYIDFRRVKNLKVYFKNNAISLTTDITQIEEWQGGDIVIFNDHIGIVSDKRNKNGVPFVLHNAYPNQPSYEEDILEFGYGKINGHYRIS